MIDKTTRAKARQARKLLNKIPPDRLSIFSKLICLAIENGINPWAPSKPKAKTKGKRQ
jgi:hypothetical protein